jgi:PAS domain S-box-containing protein/putative nucleotidyltransferase with HDIG domain
MSGTHNDVYRTFFMNSMEAMLLGTLEGKILAANPAACDIFRRTEAEIRKIGRDGLFDKDYLPLKKLIAEGDKTGRVRGELLFKRSDGTTFDGEVSAALHRSDSGQVLAIVVIRDISTHKNALKALAENEARYQRIVETSIEGILIMDRNHRITYINKQISGMLGYSAADMKGRDVSEFMLPEDLADHQHQMQLRQQGKPSKYEQRFKHADGSSVYCAVSAVPIFDEQGNFDGSFGMFSDITEQKLMQIDLAKSEMNYRILVNSMADGVISHAADGKIIAVNPAAEQILGYTAQQMLGLAPGYPAWVTTHGDGSPFPGTEHPVVLTLGTGKPQSDVVMGFMKQGKLRWISINSSPIITENESKPHAAVVTFHDITRRKETEAKILLYVKQLENSMQGTLMAVANMVEMHDPYTSGHARHVGILAADIAREMGWPEDKCRVLSLIGLVHDIGKISIPAEILSKPGRLSALEYSLIQTHAQKGHEILKDVEFPLPIAEIIYQHHEHMDGSGYPRGLKGDEILPEARIIAVAMCWSQWNRIVLSGSDSESNRRWRKSGAVAAHITTHGSSMPACACSTRKITPCRNDA